MLLKIPSKTHPLNKDIISDKASTSTHHIETLDDEIITQEINRQQ